MEYLRKAQHLRRCFHCSAHRQGSSLRSQPCPIKSKSPTGIVAHATGLYFPRGMQPYAGDLYGDCRTRNWAARNIPRGMQPHADDLYGDCRTRNRAARNVPRGMQPHADDLYGDCPTRNWAERNVPRGIQPHADDPLRGLSHTQLGGTKCPAWHTTPCRRSPTGIVPHATGRNEMSRVAYNQATRDLPHAFLRCGYTGYRSYCQ